MIGKEKLFNPLGIDHIVIACYSRHYWRNILKHIGFEDYCLPQYENVLDEQRGLERWYGIPMRFGKVKFLLVDSSTALYHPKQIYEYLVKNGDFQIFSIAVLVDSARAAQKEIGGSFIFRNDCFGQALCTVVKSPENNSFWWQFIEREENSREENKNSWGPENVDHVAIAVANLKEAEKTYKSLGFSTIYRPRKAICGKYSAMSTIAMQRGGWTVALVEGVDKEKCSQVSAYTKAHGNHSVQHIALRFPDVVRAVEELSMRQVHFRTHQLPKTQTSLVFEDILHYGKDHEGALLQAFTKPFLRFVRWDEKGLYYADGLFLECLERMTPLDKEYGRQFYNKTVHGLYDSIEREEIERDTTTIVSPAIMSRTEYDTRFDILRKKTVV